MKRVVVITLLICFCAIFCCDLQVAKADNKVKLNKTKVTIKNGTSIRLRLKNSKKSVKWSSEDKDIATVNSRGKVTGKHLGDITITAKVGNRRYKCKVTVKTDIDQKKIKVQYQNSVFTKAVLSQIQEFRMPAVGKIVRDKAAVKKIFSMVSKWKLNESLTPRGLFANTPDTSPEKLLYGEPVSMIFCLKNKECIEMELSGGQVRISRYDSLEKTNCTFSKLYEVPEDDIAFIDAVAKVVEENRVVYFW